MPTLRISHAGSYVEATFEGQSEKRQFDFALTAQEAEDIRWYLEDYRIYPVDPAPKIARRIEQCMSEAGRELFRQVLAGSGLWESMRRKLGDTRVEIETELEDALVPWELMRDPTADQPLALQVASFVRCHSQPALHPNPAAVATGKIRILLVICRLEGDRVPFRSVARHLIRGLSDAAREPFDLEVLRPPTFEQLARRLRDAKAQDRPFHAVHFDGHGLAGEVFFENPKLEGNRQPVKAAELGKLLHETRVPLLILNACRSADSEPPETPEQVGDVHAQIRQFGSFAHAVMDSGASGAVAWRYSVFVDTAAQYMADLYGALASGLPLGEAATMARKQLSSGGREIEDWTVPIVFEAAPTRLFPKAAEGIAIKLEVRPDTQSGLPHAPDVGFIGRDETILRLDRTFDEQSIVLLHAYAGSGKTSTAAEFARWYVQTGGLAGPVLFTSFEQHKTLPRVLDELGRVFEDLLAKSGIQWLTLHDEQRRHVALQVLQRVPVLWIWDNVEPIAGFPAGTPSAWSEAEQKELLDFLHAVRGTKAKFILTSRRDERGWLHDLPARIELPPMPFDESVQMTEELAKKRGRRLDDVEDWRPLLRFTQGNPLTLTVLVGQALRDGLKSREQIVDFVRKLQAGEAVFEDAASEGRTRSLAASLEYGFKNAFRETEQKELALLHLFQGFVNVEALRMMAAPQVEWRLPELSGLTRDSGIALLDRAAEVGLLTALGGGYYSIHPALPWFFQRLFVEHYRETRVAATRAFVEGTGQMAERYWEQSIGGNRDAIAVLTAEEANLLRSRDLARRFGWWRPLISAMQGLQQLYRHTGRRAAWSGMVEEIIPDFVDAQTDGPLPDKGQGWSTVTHYRVGLARDARRWQDAERLQTLLLDWNREVTRAILTRSPDRWAVAEKNSVRTLAVALHELSQIQRDRGSKACVNGFKEAMSLCEKIGDTQMAALCALNLGHTYKNLAEIRNLEVAEKYYRRSFELRAKEDRIGRAGCLIQLGSVAYGRFVDAQNARWRVREAPRYLSMAGQYYQEALEMLPTDAIGELGVLHNLLGNIHSHTGEIDLTLRHYRESVRYCELSHDRYLAGQTRFNAADSLADAGRFADAREWAQSALRDFEACENAEEYIVKSLKLLERVESALRGPLRRS